MTRLKTDRPRLSEQEWEVLRELTGTRRWGWARPMDLGASNGSHHSGTLKKLVRKGYAERIPRSTTRDDIDVDGTKKAKSWLYRITDAGLEYEPTVDEIASWAETETRA
jgi:hypothetical protein